MGGARRGWGKYNPRQYIHKNLIMRHIIIQFYKQISTRKSAFGVTCRHKISMQRTGISAMRKGKWRVGNSSLFKHENQLYLLNTAAKMRCKQRKCFVWKKKKRPKAKILTIWKQLSPILPAVLLPSEMRVHPGTDK